MRIKGRAWLGAIAAAGMAAGCSDDGGSSESRPGYGDISAEFDALADETETVLVTDPSTLPTSGSATYDGAMLISTTGGGDVPAELAGDLSLTADFGGNDISGRVTDVVSEGGREYDGSIRLDGGEIDRTSDANVEATFDFGVEGTITDGSDDLTFSGEGLGVFGGDDAEYVAGATGGVIVSSDGLAEFAGSFLGER